MHRHHRLALAAAAIFLILASASAAQEPRIDAVPFTMVSVRDAFWSARLEINRKVTIPYCFQKCEETGRIGNFEVAARTKPGGMRGYFFNDSDVYKVLEGAAYALTVHRDAELERTCDEVIAKIAAAQEPDGYLYCSRTILDAKNPPPGGKERWSDMGSGHELYCAGHLYEAAVAYAEATGKRKLLDVAVKNADLAASVFGPDGNRHPCGHPEIEIGLVKLFRTTGDRKYLDLARWFIVTRGNPTKRALFGEYAQDHRPLLEQTAAVGHSVRAAYLFAGMADVAGLTREPAYLKATLLLWEDVVRTKLYLTGGIGSRGSNEGFGEPYELPNLSAYAETCAAIANALWNHRLFLAHGDARYIDVLERIIYNGFLSGWSLAGDRFFYPNPLESRAGAPRAPWFDCACCPSNVVRFVPSIPGLAYAVRGDDLWVNLFIGGQTDVSLASGPVNLRQETAYPWSGTVKLTVTPAKPAKFRLRVRIPGFARNEVVPGDLYRFEGAPPAAGATLAVNGKPDGPAIEEGYAVLDREWKAGDVIDLEVPMPIRRVVADERVRADAGRVAFQRGPLVYCFEGLDQPAAATKVSALVVADDAGFQASHRPELLGGVTVLEGKARVARRTKNGTVETGDPVAVRAIPYFAWANRERSPMTVWVARSKDAARPEPAPTLARTAKATSSFGGDLLSISDQDEPRASDDHDHPYLHWWPRKGTTEWIQYEFPAPAEISAVEVYWFDDTGRGECRLPASWKLLVRTGGAWREVPNATGYGVAGDTYNRCSFDAVPAEALKIEVTSRDGFAGGVHEWRVLVRE